MSCNRIIILLIVLSSCLGCELRANRTGLASRPVDIVLKPIQAVVQEGGDRVVIVKETPIASRLANTNPFHQAQFVNEQKGWASTYKSLYRTSDGGSNWESLAFQAEEHSRISSFFFIDESQGWLAVTRQVYTERYGLGNSAKVLATKDGGRTWNEQVNLTDEVRIKEVSFLNANQGFASGARVIDQPANQGPPYEEMLILSTDDGGNRWTDISEGIKNTIKSDSGALSDSGRMIRSLSETETLLLTENGRVVHTSDHGKTWKIIVKFQDARPDGTASSMAYYKLILDSEQRIRVIAGAIGDEGYWGDLVVNGDKDSWTSYELSRVPILDAVYLSENEILACGLEVRAADDERSPPAVGIVLHSVDGGKSWIPLYRSRAKETFISLTKANNDNFYAVSDAGTFLRFALKK